MTVEMIVYRLLKIFVGLIILFGVPASDSPFSGGAPDPD